MTTMDGVPVSGRMKSLLVSARMMANRLRHVEADRWQRQRAVDLLTSEILAHYWLMFSLASEAKRTSAESGRPREATLRYMAQERQHMHGLLARGWALLPKPRARAAQQVPLPPPGTTRKYLLQKRSTVRTLARGRA